MLQNPNHKQSPSLNQNLSPNLKSEPQLDKDLAKKLREEELARLTGGQSTSAQQASGPQNKAQYADQIRQHIRSRIVFPMAADLQNNPEAVFEIKQLPNGEIISVTKIQASGLQEWDFAVQRAIEKSSPLPKSADGKVEAKLVLRFRPKDSN
ncbi:MAG: TonB C-terminal domain-containing protein [Limnobacter sp.]|nr:TonB C-terminal domain-containing protein [Limnobacter sp.]